MHAFHRSVYFEEKQHGSVYCGLALSSQWESSGRVLLKAKFVWLEAAAPPVEPVKSSNGKLRNRVGWSDVTCRSLVITSCISTAYIYQRIAMAPAGKEAAGIQVAKKYLRTGKLYFFAPRPICKYKIFSLAQLCIYFNSVKPVFLNNSEQSTTHRI